MKHTLHVTNINTTQPLINRLYDTTNAPVTLHVTHTPTKAVTASWQANESPSLDWLSEHNATYIYTQTTTNERETHTKMQHNRAMNTKDTLIHHIKLRHKKENQLTHQEIINILNPYIHQEDINQIIPIDIKSAHHENHNYLTEIQYTCPFKYNHFIKWLETNEHYVTKQHMIYTPSGMLLHNTIKENTHNA